MIELDLLSFQDKLQSRHTESQQWLFDPIRRKWLVLQPEELVRQLLVQYLLARGYSKNQIAIEKELIVNGLQRRFDLLIYNANTQPWLLAECKAPQVSLSDAAFRQIAQYNLALHVPYVLITNGLHTYCCQMDYAAQSYAFVQEVPPPNR